MVHFDDSYSNKRMGDLRTQEEERYIQSIAATRGFDYINLRGYTINPEALVLIPEHKAQLANLVCFDIKQRTIFVAVKNPDDTKVDEVLQNLQRQQFSVQVFLCSSQSLTHAWKRYKDIVTSNIEKRGVMEISPEDIVRMKQEIKTYTDVPRLLEAINAHTNTRRISATLELVFAGALALGASDIHIEPEETGIRLRYRFDGVLHDIVALDTYIYERMLSRLKLLSGMVLNSKKIAQDGRFTFTTNEQEIEIRSSIIPGSAGESIVMRVLDPGVASFSMDSLHLNARIREVVLAEIKKPNGLIITTGPTGSGKTTALYAFLRAAHTEEVKIITIENPVEYKLDGIVQTQVEGEYTFSAGLRAVLRQDPDIIMVGEVRDREVAETAIHAAQTGHLVFTTLHTNSAAAGFARLIDLGIDPRIFGTSINIMLGQRLVRILCERCKQQYPASAEEMKIITNVLSTHPAPPSLPEAVTLFKPAGCSFCGNTGFKGRAGIFEGIIVDTAVEEVVIRDPREHVILEAAQPQKIPSMAADGIEKVLAGITSLVELGRVIELPHDIATPSVPSETDEFLSHVVT
jgi:type IV pilus assembly protein PilB